eukprot:6906563-Pyramimonas_sp.AAC.1
MSLTPFLRTPNNASFSKASMSSSLPRRYPEHHLLIRGKALKKGERRRWAAGWTCIGDRHRRRD